MSSEPGTLKRFADHAQTHLILYNMSAMMSGVAAGFDIRISNSSAIHPRVPGGVDTDKPVMRRKEAYIGKRRDAYLAAVRDSFLEPEMSFDDDLLDAHHPDKMSNTYHGMTTRYRASIDFDAPSQHHKSLYNGYRSADSLASMTSDDNLTSRTSSPYRSSVDDLNRDVGNTSLSTSLDSEGVDCNQHSSMPILNPGRAPAQASASNRPSFGPAVEPGTAGVSPPRLQPANSTSRLLQQESLVAETSTCQSIVTSTASSFNQNEVQSVSLSVLRTQEDVAPPIPARPSRPAQRPSTLSVGSSRNQNGLRRCPPPRGASSHRAMSTPTGASLTSASSGLGESYPCLRSVTSPGSTPPHIDHPRTLLDIDMDGLRDVQIIEPPQLTKGIEPEPPSSTAVSYRQPLCLMPAHS